MLCYRCVTIGFCRKLSQRRSATNWGCPATPLTRGGGWGGRWGVGGGVGGWGGRVGAGGAL
jgi:hypothetical protein